MSTILPSFSIMRLRFVGIAAFALAAVCLPLPAGAGYIQTNLVSDIAGLAAITDPVLKNSWGISHTAASPFWVSDQLTGLATLYNVTALGVSKNAREVVQRLHIAPSIDALADGYSVVRPKPAPDLFVYAAGLLHVCVHECVVFEDAAAGVEAAKVAGMYAVGLGPRERVGQADLVLPDLSHVTLHDILQRLSPANPRG